MNGIEGRADVARGTVISPLSRPENTSPDHASLRRHGPIAGAASSVPAADYGGRLQDLSEEQQQEWALMDTHDMLITRYTFPQRWTDLQRWMRGLHDVHKPHDREMAAVGRIPAAG